MKTLMIIAGAFTLTLTIFGLTLSFGQSAQTNASNLNTSLLFGVLTFIFFGIASAIPNNQDDHSPEDLTSKLETLEQMLKNETISQEEFDQAKKDLFDK